MNQIGNKNFSELWTIYNRLKSIKNTVDPNGLFVCKNCVGSDDWSEDLNCPKTSNANEINLTVRVLLVTGNFFVFFL